MITFAFFGIRPGERLGTVAQHLLGEPLGIPTSGPFRQGVTIAVHGYAGNLDGILAEL